MLVRVLLLGELLFLSLLVLILCFIVCTVCVSECSFIETLTVLGMFVCVSFCRSKYTVSNAFDMSSAIAIVVSGVFFFMLKPVVIVVFIVCKAVMVECVVLNQCCCVWLCKLFVM